MFTGYGRKVVVKQPETIEFRIEPATSDPPRKNVTEPDEVGGVTNPNQQSASSLKRSEPLTVI